AASYVERHRNDVALFKELDVAAGFEDIAGDLVPQYQAGRSGGAAGHHVLVGAADVGGENFEDDAVVGLFTGGIDQFWKRDGLHFDLAGFDISYTSVCCHIVLLWWG